MNYTENAFFNLSSPIYRAVECDRKWLQPSLLEGRAALAGTGALYFTRDLGTCIAETSSLKNPVYYKLTPRQPIKMLDLKKHCEVHDLLPESCYAGKQSREKSIHKLYDDQIPAVSFPSQKHQGICLVIFPANAGDLNLLFQVEKLS